MTCPICGIEFDPAPRQKYCSAACRKRANNDPILTKRREIARNRRNLEKFQKLLGSD